MPHSLAMNLSIFIPYLFGRVALSLSITILSMAMGWHLYQLTGDPFDLALVGLVQVIPVLSLFLVTGWVIDRFPRKLILIICSFSEVIVLIALAIIMNSEQIQKEWILALLFINGCSRAFLAPCTQAILPNLVPESVLSKAVAITTTAWNVASTAGPLVGGILLATIDLSVYWVLALLSLSASIVFTFLPKLTRSEPLGKGLDQVLGGIKFISKNPIVLGSISVDLFIVLLGSVLVLLPVFAENILNVGAFELGLMRSMPAFGAVMVGIVMAKSPAMKHTGQWLFASLTVFSISILVFATSSTLWLSLLALWLYGASDMVSVNVRSTLVQLATPDQLRGRVSAVNSIFISTSNKMGDFRAGSVASILPPVTTVVVGSISALVVVAASYFLFPKLRKLDRMEDARPK